MNAITTVTPEDKVVKTWLIYVLRCADDTLYTGCTNNLEHRLEMHNSGKGAHYTKGRAPVELLYVEPAANRSEAQKREYEIKQLTRKEKLNLVNNLNYTSS